MSTTYLERLIARQDARIAAAKQARRDLPIAQRFKEHALDWYVALCVLVPRVPNCRDSFETRQILNDWAWAIIRWRRWRA